MWERIELILRQATEHVTEHMAEFLPGCARVAVILVLLTFVVATLVRALLVRGLRAIEFDRRAGQLRTGGRRGLAIIHQPFADNGDRRVLGDRDPRAARQPHRAQRDDALAAGDVRVRVRAAPPGCAA